MFYKTKRISALLLSIGLIVGLLGQDVSAQSTIYQNTNRDTLPPEEKMEIKEPYLEEYDELLETEHAVFYYREDRDIIGIYDKESGYFWKTGIDAGYAKTLKSKALRASEEDFEYFEANPIEDNMNEVYTDFANSLVSVEYRDPEKIENLKRASSCSKESDSTLVKLSDGKYCLEVDFKEIDLQMKMYVSFEDMSIRYQIPFEEMQGEGLTALNAIYITPFLGSSGGQVLAFNRETKAYDISTRKDTPNGYAFVPDGSGALIRFRDNSVAFQKYEGDVYGKDASQGEYYYETLSDAVTLKDTLMPVFGVAYGNDQVGFVAYADKGAEYMNVVCTPEENVTYYTWTCAKFVYNLRFHQVYNKAGDGYFTTLAQPNAFDIDMTYQFLTGDGSGATEAANYVGMAKAYRAHLIEQGILTVKPGQTDIPLRLDFILSDAKSSVVGRTNVVMTTVSDVEEIIEDVRAEGIENITGSLSGWQKDGVTFSKPYTQKFSSKIGTKNEFEDLFSKFSDLGMDYSLQQDYVTINRNMVNYSVNAVRHVNSWYAFVDKEVLLPENAPVTQFGFAKPVKSAEWLLEQFQAQKEYATSMTVKGIGETLTGDYSEKEPFTVTDAIALFQNTCEEVSQDMNVNFVSPGLYLWKYTDRFFDAPVGHSQYIFETDAVPFLQIVLNGTMEVYAPYANFSFYEQEDILKMIDFNIAPSFILSKNPSYLLEDTVSADLYSTEYTLYKDLIQNIYHQINGVLSQVSGWEWSNRLVLDNGVVENIYCKDGKQKGIVINYTENQIQVNGQTIEPLSASIVEE